LLFTFPNLGLVNDYPKRVFFVFLRISKQTLGWYSITRQEGFLPQGFTSSFNITKSEVQFRQFRKIGFMTQELIKKAAFLPEHIYVRHEKNLIT
jgi:hypothetical protein